MYSLIYAYILRLVRLYIGHKKGGVEVLAIRDCHILQDGSYDLHTVSRLGLLWVCHRSRWDLFIHVRQGLLTYTLVIELP